jgi:hypothetical protein
MPKGMGVQVPPRALLKTTPDQPVQRRFVAWGNDCVLTHFRTHGRIACKILYIRGKSYAREMDKRFPCFLLKRAAEVAQHPKRY